MISIQEITKEVEASELFFLNRKVISVSFLSDKFHEVKETEECGTGLRIVLNGREGFSTTTRLDNPKKLIENAKETALFGEKVEFSFPSGFIENENQDLNFYNKDLEDIKSDSLIGMGREILKYIKNNNKDYSVTLNIDLSFEDIFIENSAGFCQGYKRNMWSYVVQVMFLEEENILHWFNTKSGFDNPNIDENGLDNLLEELSIARKTVSPSTGKLPVIFSPTAIPFLFKTLETGISGDNIYKKLSPLHSLTGENVLDPRITIIDDGSIPGLYGSIPFDHEGVRKKVTPIFEKGVFKGGITNLKYASLLESKSTGNGFRRKSLTKETSFENRPNIMHTNLVISEGNYKLEEMINDIKDGLLVEFSPDCWMSNILAGDFAGSIAMGIKIQNGVKTGRVKNIAMAGNIYKVLKSQLIGLTDKSKISQFDNSYLTPYFYLKDISIS
jgi:PmbA protein